MVRLRATINSDDPAYFGGYLADNYLAVAEATNLSRQDLIQLARNSFLGSFLSAEEINDLGEAFEIVSEASDFVEVRKALQAAGIDYDSAEATFIPSVEVPLDLEGARKMMRVIDALEDSDDVQNVYANGDISDEVLAQLDEE